MKKLFVNEEACIGCGACVAIDSEHFDFNDDGLSEVVNNENIEGENTKNAMSSCPTNAIVYIEEDGCDCEGCDCENCDCGEECTCGDECSCGEECQCTPEDHCGCKNNNSEEN